MPRKEIGTIKDSQENFRVPDPMPFILVAIAFTALIVLLIQRL